MSDFEAVKDHDACSLQSVAGDGVAHRQDKKREAEGQHNYVHHLHAPERMGGIVRCYWYVRAVCSDFGRSGIRCHSTNIFSRWKRPPRYRNLI